MAIDKNQHLELVLQSHRMKNVQTLLDKYLKKREEIAQALQAKYASKLASNPINSGSYAKHTAVNVKFDIDLCVPFNRDSFSTLDEMAEDLKAFFQKEYKDPQLKNITEQRVSLGLDFIIDGDTIEVDIVPGREINKGEYPTTGDLNLRLRPRDGGDTSSLKSNIKKHIETISGRNAERQIIRLLKLWKFYNAREKKYFKSFIIELIVLRAFDDNSNNIPDGIWEKLEMTLNYLIDKIGEIRLEDPANSSNVVSELISAEEKVNIATDMKNMLRQINANPEIISAYFKVNPKFPTGESVAAFSVRDNSPSTLTGKTFGGGNK